MSKKINYNQLEKLLGIKYTVTDINILDIPKNKLTLILNKIDSMTSHEKINDLLLLFGNTNAINPNRTIFHSCTINAIIKYNVNKKYKKN